MLNLVLSPKFRFFSEPRMQALKNLGLGANVSQILPSHKHERNGFNSSPEPGANYSIRGFCFSFNGVELFESSAIKQIIMCALDILFEGPLKLFRCTL